SKQALAADVLTSLAGFQPPALMAMSARQASHAPSPVNTVATNVPGPRHPLFILGRKMLDNYPYVPLASTMRVGTTVFSYDGYARFGVTGDYESMPDIQLFADGLNDGIRELTEADPITNEGRMRNGNEGQCGKSGGPSAATAGGA
ncbi:MAG: WS/DGAT domain-containing protein, partial [Acetobacteraceae bacterium]